MVDQHQNAVFGSKQGFEAGFGHGKLLGYAGDWLKRVVLKRLQSTRFKFLFFVHVVVPNRCALLGDMHGGLTP
jgi:hypothetical protein